MIYTQASPYGIAIQKGWFDEAFPNTKINWIQGTGGAAALTGLASGSLDMALLGNPGVAVGIAQGLDLIVPYVYEGIDKNEGLIVRKTANIKTAQDLRGKTIGVTSASTNDLELIGYLTLNGMSESDLNIVNGPLPDLQAGWERGSLDGVATGTPFTDKMLTQGGEWLFWAGQIADKGWGVQDLLVVRRAFAEQYPDTVKKYIEVNDRSVKYLKSNPDDSYGLMGTYMSMTPDQAKALMAGATYVTVEDLQSPTWLGGGIQQGLENAAKVWAELGKIQTAPSNDKVEAAVTTEYLQASTGP